MWEILLVGENSLFWNGLERLLSGAGFTATRSDEGFNALAAKNGALRGKIVILGDVDGSSSAIDLCVELCAAARGISVILVVKPSNQGKALPAIEAGVQGIVTTLDTPDTLFECVREVESGRRWINQSVLQAALDSALGKSTSLLDQLTPREKEVAIAASEGHSTADIAQQKKLSSGTVKVHFHNIYKKLGMKGRAELIARVHDEMSKQA